MSELEIFSAYFMSVLMDRMKALIASSLTRNSKATSCRNGEPASQRSRILCSEVQTGSYLGEDDIIRIEDDHGAREAASHSSQGLRDAASGIST